MMPAIAMQDSWLEIIARTGQCSAGEARSMAAEIIKRRKEDKQRQEPVANPVDYLNWSTP